ncbi:hypothetical protein RHODO2019_00295 [Rhodococcus antarcticus]|uniref:Uncharacterized protein n=1 Tax=Rhodococcus antarcticus TaxID=2987751 RepID=A0ABY6P0W9_9NOCA|nr:hypothetical protein [Rhodococcus antarcticus]UZJ24996.1 hypothetical protein RHODO2019_00295 [Rhodococcus antarcticus]
MAQGTAVQEAAVQEAVAQGTAVQEAEVPRRPRREGPRSGSGGRVATATL